MTNATLKLYHGHLRFYSEPVCSLHIQQMRNTLVLVLIGMFTPVPEGNIHLISCRAASIVCFYGPKQLPSVDAGESETVKSLA